MFAILFAYNVERIFYQVYEKMNGLVELNLRKWPVQEVLHDRRMIIVGRPGTGMFFPCENIIHEFL